MILEGHTVCPIATTAVDARAARLPGPPAKWDAGNIKNAEDEESPRET